jgi:hypothetical protein
VTQGGLEAEVGLAINVDKVVTVNNKGTEVEREEKHAELITSLFTVATPNNNAIRRSGREEKEVAMILRRLKEQRVMFDEACTTSIFRTFSVSEPGSSYWITRRWINERNNSALVCNVLNLFDDSTVEKRIAALSGPSKRMYDTPNAGGNSLWSEVVSLEMLAGMYGATLLRTEMEILYGCHSKITDYSIQVMGHHIGVSVTRAMKFRGIFHAEDALRLMKKKLNGVVRSTRGVIREHRWEKQILHVFAECDYVADAIRRAYDAEVDEDDKANTLIIITVARDCPWMF